MYSEKNIITAALLRIVIGSIVGVILIGILIANKPFYTVQPGTVAIHKRLGRIVDTHRDGGIYFKMPFIDTIAYMNTRICKSKIETESLSKDLQFVSIGIAINYQIEDALNLYKEVGTDFDEVIVNPLAQESIKAIVACYTAEELIQHRHVAKDAVLTDIRERLIPRYINLIDFNFVHLDFHREFMKAVEDKQIAQQAAMTAHNLTEKVKEEMLQKRMAIDTNAYELKVMKEQTTPLLLELKKIEKWDGVLPQVTSSATPWISLR